MVHLSTIPLPIVLRSHVLRMKTATYSHVLCAQSDHFNLITRTLRAAMDTKLRLI